MHKLPTEQYAKNNISAGSKEEPCQKESMTSNPADSAQKKANASLAKEQALIDFDKGMKRKLKIAKLIVLNIGIMSFFIDTICFIFFWGFSFVTILAVIIQAVLSIALISGVSWVRYLFAACSFLSIMPLIACALFVMPASALLAITFCIMDAIYNIICVIMLIFNKYIGEYFYAKKYN